MKQRISIGIVIILFLLLAAMFLFLAYAPSGATANPVFASVYPGPLRLPERSKTDGCTARNGLPDPRCTPGAVFPDATKETVCTKGYTKTVRDVSAKLKKQVYAEYSLSYPQASGAYEADHFIPLELGGNNDIANLFPEAARPTPGFREKDLVENYLNDVVCDGRISLVTAQKLISTNWVAVYDSLSREEIQKLKREFSRW